MKNKLYDRLDDPFLKQREKDVEAYYNKVLDREDGYQLLIKINKHFTEINNDKDFSKSKQFEPIGDKSRQLYFRIKELDSIDLSDKMFSKGSFAEDLREINAFYYYSMKIINPELFYRYDMKRTVMTLRNHEKQLCDFYDSVVSLFIDKTDSFFTKKIFKTLQEEDKKTSKR